VLWLLGALHRDEAAVVPVTVRGLEPLHAVYSTGALPALRTALGQGRLGLQALLADIHTRAVPEAEWRPADPSGRFAFNLNRAEDLALLDHRA
jgi:molybdopterin-guanine dinucleotide biosynthesis protein A